MSKSYVSAALLAIGIVFLQQPHTAAQSPAPGQSAASTAPTIIPVSGEIRAADGQPRTGPVLLVLSLYEGKDDPAPRWIEHQAATLDANGRYAVQFGATREDGLPADLFTGEVKMRWLGVAIENEPEQPRMMLVSVPYAAKAGSADTLAGKALSDFVLTSTLKDDVRTVLQEDGLKTTNDATTRAVTANFLQKGTGVGVATTDSTITDVGGNVGIGTATPAAQLHVAGFSPEIRADRTGGALGLFRASSTVDFGSFSSHDLRLFANSSEVMRLSAGGKVGIGTATPASRLHIVDSVESEFRLQITGGALAVIRGVLGAADFGSFSNHPVRMFVNSQEVLHATPAGDIGIGTTVPTAKLHVAGNAVIDGNIAAKYQDVAEWVEASEPLEPGSLVIIDTTAMNRVKASRSAYDARVAGAVSPQPGLVLGEQAPGKVLIAQSGRVRVKADARNGAIRPGDLLVSSPVTGRVMKSRPVNVGGVSVHRPGTVVGKALEALPKGQGDILVLLTLQ